KEIATTGGRDRGAKHALDLGDGVTGEKRFRSRRSDQAQSGQMVLRGARREEAADVLKKCLRPRESVLRGGVRNAVDAIASEQLSPLSRQMDFHSFGHRSRRSEPEGSSAKCIGRRNEMISQSPSERVNDE